MFPHQRNALVTCCLLTENQNSLKQKKENYTKRSDALKGRVAIVLETDLLLDPTFGQASKVLMKKKDSGICWERHFRTQYELIRLYPNSAEELQQAFFDSVSRAFQAKIDRIGASYQKRRNIGCLALSVVIAAGAILYPYFFQNRDQLLGDL